MAQPSTQPLAIAYAPPPPIYRRQWVRLTLVACLLTAALASSPRWFPPAVHRAKTLYWQRRAMTFPAVGSRVVYEDDPAAAAALLNVGGADYVRPAATGPAVYFAKPWRNFYALVSPPGRKPAATLFLHRLQADGRSPRLVAVDATFVCGWGGPGTPGAAAPRVGMALNASVFQPGSVLSDPRLVANSAWVAPFSTGPDSSTTRFRFYAGRPDPEDPAHFTIAFEKDGRHGEIDGWLRADDSVLLEYHFASDAPAAPPPASLASTAPPGGDYPGPAGPPLSPPAPITPPGAIKPPAPASPASPR